MTRRPGDACDGRVIVRLLSIKGDPCAYFLNESNKRNILIPYIESPPMI